jgi:hypothetical protein
MIDIHDTPLRALFYSFLGIAGCLVLTFAFITRLGLNKPRFPEVSAGMLPSSLAFVFPFLPYDIYSFDFVAALTVLFHFAFQARYRGGRLGGLGIGGRN